MMQVEMLESMVVNRQDREIGEVVTVDNDLGRHMIRSGWAAEHTVPAPAAEAEHTVPAPAAEAEGESPRRAGKRRTTYNNPELSSATHPPTEDS